MWAEICRLCRQNLPPVARFCPRCGQRVPAVERRWFPYRLVIAIVIFVGVREWMTRTPSTRFTSPSNVRQTDGGVRSFDGKAITPQPPQYYHYRR